MFYPTAGLPGQEIFFFFPILLSQFLANKVDNQDLMNKKTGKLGVHTLW